MKRKKVNKMTIHLIFIITAVFALIGTSFAWFYDGDSFSSSLIEIDTIDSKNLQIKVSENDEYTTGSKEFAINQDFTYKEVSASLDGNSLSFYTFTKTGLDSNNKENEGYDSNDAVASNLRKITSNLDDYVFTLDFTLKSTENSYLYLNKNSNVSPLSVEEISSVYGNFSKDYIAGAVRVAIYKLNSSTDEYEPCFIWIPNTSIELSLDSEGYKLNPTGTVEESFMFLENGKYSDNTIILTNNQLNGNTSLTINNKSINVVWGDLSDNEVPITYISAGESEFRMVSWIDGYDRETKIPLAGGKINFDLIFSIKLENEGNR